MRYILPYSKGAYLHVDHSTVDTGMTKYSNISCVNECTSIFGNISNKIVINVNNFFPSIGAENY